MSDKAQPSPEIQLFARMRLQRVVFGAFAIVLVCLFALGLSAYRKMQSERDTARHAEADALARASVAENKAVQNEKRRQETSKDLRARERELALSKCRLAMVEIRDGNTSRAAALLSEAETLGLPRWAPMVERLTQAAPPRFSGSEHDEAPIVAGAVSGDGQVVAVARQTDDGVVVETWREDGGEVLAAYPPAGPVPDLIGQNVRLLLSRDGSSWFLPLPEVSFHGTEGMISPVYVNRWEKGVPLSGVAANESLTTIYIATDKIILLEQNAARQWGVSPYQLWDEPVEALAVCIVAGRLVVATKAGVYRSDVSGASVSMVVFDSPADKVELHYGAGAMYIAVLKGSSLRLIALAVDEPAELASSLHGMPDDFCEDLTFLHDDSLVWVGRSGRVFTVGFSDKREWTLGGYTVSFVEQHSRGLIFGNRKGELSVRVQEELQLRGLPVHAVPPQFAPDAQAHGFVLKAPDGRVFVLQDRLRDVGAELNVRLTPAGPVWRGDEMLQLPGGGRSAEPGVLLGALGDGSAVLHHSPRKLKLVSQREVIERLLPVDRVPESVVVAASARVVALRIRDNVYVTDFGADPEPVASRMDASPDLLALDASGVSLAIAYGPTIIVQQVDGDIEYTVRANTPPRQIALMFGGTVLVTVEAGSLVFYETATGRELIRAGVDVTSIATAGDGALNIVAGSRLYKLRWG